MKIALLGPPGAGKGTFAQMLEDEFKVKRFVMGDLLREEVKKKTKLGKEIKNYIDNGVLVPDEIACNIMRRKIKGKKNYILDGFPRTLLQVKSFKEDLDKVIYITTKNEIAISRLAGRRQCSKCHRVYHIKTNPPKEDGKCDFCKSKLYIRTDETEEAIKQRLENYKKETEPVIEYYKKKKILVEINGNRSIKEVYEDIRKLFK